MKTTYLLIAVMLIAASLLFYKLITVNTADRDKRQADRSILRLCPYAEQAMPTAEKPQAEHSAAVQEKPVSERPAVEGGTAAAVDKQDLMKDLPPAQPAEDIQVSVEKQPDRFLVWLKGNYPQQEAEIAKLRAEDPDAYERQLAFSMKKYRRIVEVSESNPLLAEVLKDDIYAHEQIDSLLDRIRTATDEPERLRLTDELGRWVADSFDSDLRKSRLELEQYRKQLAQLKQNAAGGPVDAEQLQQLERKIEWNQEYIATWTAPGAKEKYVPDMVKSLLR